MFVVPDEIPNTEDEGAILSGDADLMALKPMNCPAHDQLVEEVRKFCELLHSVYQDLGFTDYAVKLALRPEKRFGSDEMWDQSEQELRDASDRVLPDRLDASYVGEDGNRHRPIMLHRAILGTFERFIGILIEHHAGRFPLWLSPVQAVVATIVSDADDYAEDVAARLRKAGLRREAEEGKVAIRRLGSQAQQIVTIDEALAMLRDEALAPDMRG
ncbi:hypothetical protein WR25_26581 [Diploscapter pachys]|uniref:Aminoacyl-tRNA synthetase class II (G/ P/ S/T) domain-containing protein n=1 Tax=Diploscapter pachys TaxID=2018661 RepID=A0A2A2KIG5_9BILA|nr:hypothetical protein WR25_26581 [Diploscapter pachys]